MLAQNLISLYVDFDERMVFMFIERLNALLKERGITRKKFLEDVGMGKNSFIYWEKDGRVPNNATFKAIADYFGVSVEYLKGESDERGGSAAIGPALSEEQLALLMEIKSLPEDQQKEAWDYIQYLKSKRQ